MLLEQAGEAPEIEFHKKENNINPQQFFSEITKTTLNTPFKKCLYKFCSCFGMVMPS